MKKLNKIKISMFIAIIGFTSLLIGTSYALFNTVLNSDKEQVIKTGSIALKYEDLSEFSSLNLKELTDTEGKVSDIFYRFTLENIGTDKAYYEVLLADDTEQNNTTTQILDDKYIKASIEVDGNIQPVINLEEENRNIFQDVMEIAEKKEYKLRVWLNFDGLTKEEKLELINQKINLKIKIKVQQLTNQITSYVLSNMIKNGSFESGGNNWNLQDAAVVQTESYNGANSLKLSGGVTAMSTQTLDYSSPTLNHIYYGRLFFKSNESYTNADNRYEWYYTDAAGALMVFANKNTKSSEWTLISSLQQMTMGDYLSNSWYIRNFTVNGSSDSYVDDLVIYDLTEIFGEGNEPTKEWCDKNLPYVNSTVQLDIYESGRVTIIIDDETPPTINLKTTGGKQLATIDATITDNIGIVAYAVTSSSDNPTEWTNVSNTEALNVSFSKNSAGTYYVHAIDANNNSGYSKVTLSLSENSSCSCKTYEQNCPETCVNTTCKRYDSYYDCNSVCVETEQVCSGQMGSMGNVCVGGYVDVCVRTEEQCGYYQGACLEYNQSCTTTCTDTNVCKTYEACWLS